MTLRKSKVTLAGVPLVATVPFVWRFVGGVQPYTTIATFHRTDEKKVENQIGQRVRLRIEDSRGEVVEVSGVYILHKVASGSPNRVSYLIADKRWRWPYDLVVRDYNIVRKTGDQQALGNELPQTRTIVDTFKFLEYSLDGDKPWTAKRAVEDVLKQIEGKGRENIGYKIESFPIENNGQEGELSLQNVSLRDAGDVALARLLAYVPGTDIYIDAKGIAVVRDATDLRATKEHLVELEDTLRAHQSGDVGTWVERKAIRPGRIFVYYQRELEALFDYRDDYSTQTRSQLSRSAPFLENVMPNVDFDATLTEYDPQENALIYKNNLFPGTWIEASSLLEYWDDTKPGGSAPVTFSTISLGWVSGVLEGKLGFEGKDRTESAADINVGARLSALRQHFRQTFRINRRYTERIRQMLPVRAGLLDPVTGARQPASVWSQTCRIGTLKGDAIFAGRAKAYGDTEWKYRNLDYTLDQGKPLVQTTPAPVRLSFIDAETGVFRIDWVPSLNGLEAQFTPGKTWSTLYNGELVLMRNLALQDSLPVVDNAQVESAGTIRLASQMRMYALFTIVPAGPNNRRQFHREEVAAKDIDSLFRSTFRLQGGTGPDLHIYVPPGEATSRHAWTDDDQATKTLQSVLGLEDEEGLDGNDLPGYTFVNQQAIREHAIAYAAEQLSVYADGAEGQIVTIIPKDGVKFVGNMGSVAIRVGSGESGKIDVEHSFVGRQRRINRLAFMDPSIRRVVYGQL